MGHLGQAVQRLRSLHRSGVLGIAYVVLLLAGAAVFLIRQSSPSCTPPPDQRRLLTAYTAEPVLKISPPDAKFSEEESLAKDCLPKSGIRENLPAPHRAFVSREYDLARPMTVRRMFDHYGPAAQSTGWILIDTSQSRSDGGNYIVFCKNIAETVTHLTVQTWGASPTKMSARIFTPLDDQPTCPDQIPPPAPLR
jgi:hypothetical protein